jgi:hypothetical protein
MNSISVAYVITITFYYLHSTLTDNMDARGNLVWVSEISKAFTFC